jgi:hypothetical protein
MEGGSHPTPPTFFFPFVFSVFFVATLLGPHSGSTPTTRDPGEQLQSDLSHG